LKNCRARFECGTEASAHPLGDGRRGFAILVAEDAQADGREFRAGCAGCRTSDRGRARADDEAAEAAQEAAALAESQQLAGEIRALHHHIDNLVGGREDPVLVEGLKEELSELEHRQSDLEQRIEQRKSRRHQALENAVRELESAEQQHRQVADQAMRLRKHIEKISHH
jgi:hypothetical protein